MKATTYLQDGMACRPDVASCETTEKTETDSSTSCSCTASVTVSCSIDTDYTTDDENHDFGIWMATISMRKPVQMMVVLQLLNQMMQVVAILTLGHTRAVPHDTRMCDASCSDGESDSDSDSAGDKRSWEQTNDINCNNRNVVDGGGETSGDDSSKQS